MLKTTKSLIFFAACLFLSEMAAQLPCEPIWRYTNFGQLPGLRSIQSKDLDGDGIPEILVNSKGEMGWYIMNYIPSEGKYKITWTSPPALEAEIVLLTIIDWDEDGEEEIFASDAYGRTTIYNGQNLEVVAYFELPTPAITRVLFEDADNDGVKELLLCSEYDAFVVNATSFQIEFQFNLNTRDVVVGQLDTDADLEIVNADGDVFQLNGSNLTMEWNAFDESNFYNIRHIELVQVDQDPNFEFLIAYGQNIRIFDAVEQQEKYFTNSNYKITDLRVYPALDASQPKIYIGDELGNIYGYSNNLIGNTLIINGTANQLNGVCGFVVSDADNDGSLEVVMGEGCTTNSGHHIQVYDYSTGDLEWSHLDLSGPFSALTYVETTNKILGHSLTIEGGFTGGTMVEIDPATGEELGQFPDVFASHELYGIKNVKLEETQPEKLLFYGQYKVSLVSVENYAELKSYNESFDTYYSAEVADLDNDGVKEILVGNQYGVDIFDADLNKIGNLVADFDITTEIKAVNIDNDEKLEIIFANKYVNVFDDNFQLIWESAYQDILGIDVLDKNGDGILDIVASDKYGNLIFFSTSDFGDFQLINIGTEDVNSVDVVDLNADGIEDLLALTQGKLYYINDINQRIQLNQEAGVTYYVRDFLEFEDLDMDGLKDIIYANNYSISASSSSCLASILLGEDGPQAEAAPPFVVFPTPTTDHLNIKSHQQGDFILQLWDFKSQLLVDAENTTQISLHNFPNGVYYLRLIEKASGKSFVQKIIKTGA